MSNRIPTGSEEVTALLGHVRAAGQRDGGFTLIELLIVIVILGVLSGVVIFAVNGVNDRGKQAACIANKTTLQTAAEAYYAKHAHYPVSVDDMTTGDDRFLQSVPTDATYVPGTPATAPASYTITGC
jgi:general secretion pathway protein G